MTSTTENGRIDDGLPCPIDGTSSALLNYLAVPGDSSQSWLVWLPLSVRQGRGVRMFLAFAVIRVFA
jgi:hypothetical protein